MGERQRTTNRWTTAAGLFCLAASLLLSSTGVRAVRAEGAEEALMSIDPKLEARLEPSPPAQPAPPPRVVTPPPEVEHRPGEPAVETQPGVIVLNTRGYNYGPPAGEIDPAALDHEAPPARPAR
jgi:hypothetical protein